MRHDVGQTLVLTEVGEPCAHETALERQRQIVSIRPDQSLQMVQIIVADILVNKDSASPVHYAHVHVL
jgi:hypothetical protein